MELHQRELLTVLPRDINMPEPIEELQNLVGLAAQVSDTPVAFIFSGAYNGIQMNTIHGELEGGESISFCLNGGIQIVQNAVGDQRFKNCSLENGLSVGFFATLPIELPSGFIPYYLCIMDSNSRSLTEKQISLLKAVCRQVAVIIKYNTAQYADKNQSKDSISINDAINSIFKNAIDAVIVIDRRGIIQYWNPKAEILFGWNTHEVIGKYFHNLLLPNEFHEEHLAILSNYDDYLDLHNVSSVYLEICANNKDKHKFDISLGIAPTTIKDSSFFICSISDITSRKLINAKLDSQKEFYENILNKLPTDIAVFDADHKYLFVNPGAISVEEYRKFIIGKDDYEYASFRNRPKSSADARRAKFLDVKKSGKEIRWEDTLPDPNGYMITHLRRMYPVHNDQGELTMVIGFGIDITERKLMEEKQSVLVNQLSAQNIQLIDFCNIVSHNLRAPLVNMSMLVDLIEKTTDITKRSVYVSKLKPVLATLNSTFNELVESIQIKQDLEIESEHINLNTCLERTLKSLDLEINVSEAVIESDFSEAPSIYFPSKYLYSLFQNFLSNSLKYKSPDRKLVVRFESKKLSNKVLFSVTDNGMGIDLIKYKDSIFKIGKVFHRHPDARGFGLFMTKSQIEAMNSKIWLESTPDVGTTFYIEFSNQLQ